MKVQCGSKDRGSTSEDYMNALQVSVRCSYINCGVYMIKKKFIHYLLIYVCYTFYEKHSCFLLNLTFVLLSLEIL